MEGGATSTVVTGLAVDTTYSCLVRSTVRDVVGGEFPMMTLSDVADGFTYPACEEEHMQNHAFMLCVHVLMHMCYGYAHVLPLCTCAYTCHRCSVLYTAPTAPPQPKPSNMRPSPTTITVEFFFADDHNTISHYQVSWWSMDVCSTLTELVLGRTHTRLKDHTALRQNGEDLHVQCVYKSRSLFISCMELGIFGGLITASLLLNTKRVRVCLLIRLLCLALITL